MHAWLIYFGFDEFLATLTYAALVSQPILAKNLWLLEDGTVAVYRRLAASLILVTFADDHTACFSDNN